MPRHLGLQTSLPALPTPAVAPVTGGAVTARGPGSPPQRLESPRLSPTAPPQEGLFPKGTGPVTAAAKAKPRGLYDKITSSLFGADSLLDAGERKAATRAGLLSFGTSFLKAQAPRPRGTRAFLADLGTAIEAGQEGSLRQQEQAVLNQQRNRAAGGREIMATFLGKNTADPVVLQDMWAQLMTGPGGPDYQGAGEVMDLLEHIQGNLKEIDLGDRVGLVNPFTGQEVVSIDKGTDRGALFTQANQAFNQFSGQTSEHRKTAVNYRKLRAAALDPTPAGDVALIFAFMKIIDPGSVVRESEFAVAGNTGSIPIRLYSFWNRIKTGERLTEGQRADFLRQANNLARATSEDLQGHIASFVERGQRLSRGLKPGDFTYDYFTGIQFTESDEREGDYSGRAPSSPDAGLAGVISDITGKR